MLRPVNDRHGALKKAQVVRPVLWKVTSGLRFPSYERALKWDEFGNVTLISEKANEYFKFKNPQEYLNELKDVGPELLERHFIPMNSNLWNVDNYDRFLGERMKLVTEALEKELARAQIFSLC